MKIGLSSRTVGRICTTGRPDQPSTCSACHCSRCCFDSTELTAVICEKRHLGEAHERLERADLAGDRGDGDRRFQLRRRHAHYEEHPPAAVQRRGDIGRLARSPTTTCAPMSRRPARARRRGAPLPERGPRVGAAARRRDVRHRLSLRRRRSRACSSRCAPRWSPGRRLRTSNEVGTRPTAGQRVRRSRELRLQLAAGSGRAMLLEQPCERGAGHAIRLSRRRELGVDRPLLRGPRVGSAGRPDPRLSAQRPGVGQAGPGPAGSRPPGDHL